VGDPVPDLAADPASSPVARVDCAVVIVTFNNADDIVALLDSLPAATRGLTTRCVVVDNGSTDGTADLVRERPRVVCIESGDNLGYAGGLNLGRRYTGLCSSVAILNPDLVLEPDAITRLYEALADPAVGIAVPTVLDSDGRLYPSLRREPSVTRALGDALCGGRLPGRPGWLSEIVGDKDAYRHRHAVDWSSGAALLVSWACDGAVGDWDDVNYFLYSEEVDFAARARDAGFRIDFVPNARVRHRGGGSGQSQTLAALMAVNRVRYFRSRHGRLAAGTFRLIVGLHELLRSADAAHRYTLRTVLSRSSWPALPGGRASRAKARR